MLKYHSMSNNHIVVAENKVQAETSVKYSLISLSLARSCSLIYVLFALLLSTWMLCTLTKIYRIRKTTFSRLKTWKSTTISNLKSPLRWNFTFSFDTSFTAGIDCMKTDWIYTFLLIVYVLFSLCAKHTNHVKAFPFTLQCSFSKRSQKTRRRRQREKSQQKENTLTMND